MAGNDGRKKQDRGSSPVPLELAEARKIAEDLSIERDMLRRALNELGAGVILDGNDGSGSVALNDSVVFFGDIAKSISHIDREDGPAVSATTIRSTPSSDDGDAQVRRIEIAGETGELRTIEVRSTPVRLNGKTAFLRVLTDVSGLAGADPVVNPRESWEEKLLEDTADGVFVLDMDLNIIRTNHGVYVQRYIDEKQVNGVSWFHLVPDDLSVAVRGFFERVKRKGCESSFSTSILDTHGNRVEAEMCAFLTNTPSGNLPRIVVRLHDVSGAFRQMDGLRKLASVIENSPIPVAEFDDGGEIVYVNTAFQKLTGFTGKTAYGKSMQELFARPSYEEVEGELIRSLASKGQWLGEVVIRNVEGIEFPSEIRISSVGRKGDGKACVAFITDISERKRTEAALVQHADNLQQLVHAKTYELHEKEDRYRTFLENLEDIAYEVDTEGKILYVNQAAAKFSGLSVEDIVGDTVDGFFTDDSLDAAKESLRRVLQGECCEAELTFWNGVTCHFKSSPLRNPSGEIVGAFGTARDITERKKARDALRRSEEKLKQVVQHMPVMMNAYDEDRNFVAWNGECERLTGYSAEEIIGNPKAFDILYPDPTDGARFREMFPWRGRDFNPIEWTITCRDGTKRTMLSYNISKLFPISGWYSWAVGVDITERKKGEEALLESERNHRTTMNAMIDLVHVVDRNLVLILANTALKNTCQELGIRSDLEGKKLAEAFPFLPAKILKEYRQVLSSGKPLMTEESTEIDGRELFTETRKIPIFEGNRVGRILTAMRDITELRKAERSLEHRIELERLLTHVSTQFINLPSGELDRAISAALGAMSEFVEADRAFVYILSDDKATMQCTHHWRAKGVRAHRGCRSDIPACDIRWTIERLRKLEAIHVHSVSSLPSNASQEAERFQRLGIKSTIAIPLVSEGNLKGFFSLDSLRKEREWTEEDTAILRHVAAIFINALERKDSEEKLRQSEALARALLDSSEDPMVLMELDGTVVATNEVTARRVGLTMDELVSENMLERFPSDVRKFRKRKIQEVIKTGKRVRFEDDLSNKVYDTTVDPIRDAEGTLNRIALVARDVTELKRLQDQLQVSAKLASLGVFVAGIAHEINNPLASIKVDIQRLRKKAALRDDCDKIIATIGRISTIVDNLLKYARGQGTVVKQNKVEKIIESALEIAKDRFRKERKEIILNDGTGDAKVFCDFGKLQQVFLNLAVNACDAMKHGGKLDITTRYDEEKRQVVISFRDDGRGVAKGDVGRVFDPFFTTKSSGTGLGLSISHRIIQDHNGTIELRSEPKKGTEVIIRLPAEMK